MTSQPHDDKMSQIGRTKITYLLSKPVQHNPQGSCLGFVSALQVVHFGGVGLVFALRLKYWLTICLMIL